MNNLLKVLSVSLLASGVIFAADSGKEECKEECRAEGQPLVLSGIYAPEGVQPGERLLEEQPAAAVSASAPAFSVREDTDTKVLLGCLETGDMRPYVEHIKACAKTRLGVYIDTLLRYNGPFLSSLVVVGASASASSVSYGFLYDHHSRPYDLSRDAFKEFVYARLNSVYLLGHVPVPADASLSSINQYVEAVNAAMAKEVADSIDSLLCYNGRFLSLGVIPIYNFAFASNSSSVASYGGINLYGHSRDEFKNVLSDIIDPKRIAMRTYFRDTLNASGILEKRADYVAVLRGTDTEALLLSVCSGNTDQYLENVKYSLGVKLDAYIDSLATASDQFLDHTVAVGAAMQPVAHTSNALKTVLGAHLSGLDLRGVPVPANASLKSIARFVVAIDDEIMQSVSTYIDALKPSNEGDFLGARAAIGGVGQPADRTRDAFKNALWPVIFD